MSAFQKPGARAVELRSAMFPYCHQESNCVGSEDVRIAGLEPNEGSKAAGLSHWFSWSCLVREPLKCIGSPIRLGRQLMALHGPLIVRGTPLLQFQFCDSFHPPSRAWPARLLARNCLPWPKGNS